MDLRLCVRGIGRVSSEHVISITKPCSKGMLSCSGTEAVQVIDTH